VRAGGQQLGVELVNRHGVDTGKVSGRPERFASGDDEDALALLVAATAHGAAPCPDLLAGLRPLDIGIDAEGGERRNDIARPGYLLKPVFEDQREIAFEDVPTVSDDVRRSTGCDSGSESPLLFFSVDTL